MINSLVLILGTSTFIIALFIHILLWRIKRPVRQLMWLGIIFIFLPVILYVMLSFYRAIGLSLLWHLALSSAYIASYPLFQARCPSFKIILAVSSSMPEGMPEGSINNLFTHGMLINDRLDDLIKEKLVAVKDGAYILSPQGRILTKFFNIYRRLLGLPQGEG